MVEKKSRVVGGAVGMKSHRAPGEAAKRFPEADGGEF